MKYKRYFLKPGLDISNMIQNFLEHYDFLINNIAEITNSKIKIAYILVWLIITLKLFKKIFHILR